MEKEMIGEQMKMYCKMCCKEQEFASSETPSGFKICTNCGFRVGSDKRKLVLTSYGYTFVDD